MLGYKLFRKRVDGSYGPLFINCRKKLLVGVTYQAEDHPTKGYAHRPGWHICAEPTAPHLSKRNRVWCQVKFTPKEKLNRPKSQGGLWYLGSDLTILKEI